jgi:hypothetical protein
MQANRIMRTTERVQVLFKRRAARGGEDARAVNGHRHCHPSTEIVVLSVFLAERVETEDQCVRVSLIFMARGKLKTMVFVCRCSSVSYKSLFCCSSRLHRFLLLIQVVRHCHSQYHALRIDDCKKCRAESQVIELHLVHGRSLRLPRHHFRSSLGLTHGFRLFTQAL